MAAQTEALLFLLRHFENHGNVHTGREAQRHLEAVEAEREGPLSYQARRVLQEISEAYQEATEKQVEAWANRRDTEETAPDAALWDKLPTECIEPVNPFDTDEPKLPRVDTSETDQPE